MLNRGQQILCFLLHIYVSDWQNCHQCIPQSWIPIPFWFHLVLTFQMVHSKEKLRNNINKVLPYFRQFRLENIIQAFYPVIGNTHSYYKIYSTCLTVWSITIVVEGMCKYHCTVSWCNSNPAVSIKTPPYIHLYAWNNSSSLQIFITFDTNKIN